MVAMSGGVDSSVAAHLLKEKGYDVLGVVMMMSDAHEIVIKEAKKASDKLGIDLIIKDLREEFKREIIDFFASEYLSGRTPSPCVRCNPRIKFKYLLKTALENGCDLIATGHYGAIDNVGGIYKLRYDPEDKRDQTYMLAGLKQDVLSRLLLPISGMEKSAVRAIAKDIGLECHDSPDSEENCFIPDNDYAKYIEENYEKSLIGDFISPEGKAVGKHKGILHYTVGQRKGLGIALGKPCFVTKIDPVKNEVVLGYEKAKTERIYLSDLSEAFSGAIYDGMDIYCKLRSTGRLLKATLKLEDKRTVVILNEPTERVSDGQSCAIYQDGYVLGNATINGGE